MKRAMAELRDFFSEHNLDWEKVSVKLEFKDPSDEAHFRNALRASITPLEPGSYNAFGLPDQMEGIRFSSTNRWETQHAAEQIADGIRRLKNAYR